MNHRTRISTIFSVMCISYTLTTLAYMNDSSTTKPSSKIQQLHCSIPTEIDNIIHNFNAAKATPYIQAIHNPQIILHGPSGNGKSAIPYYIAQHTASELIVIKSATLIRDYQYNYVKIPFEDILHTIKSGRNVILCIDDIDNLMTKDPYEYRVVEMILTELSEYLSELSIDARFLFICTTQSLDTISKKFINSLDHMLAINLPNPSFGQRKELIHNCYTHIKIPLLNTAYISNLLQQLREKLTDPFNTGFDKHIKNTETFLDLLDKDVRAFHTIASSETMQATIGDIINEILYCHECLLDSFNTLQTRILAQRFITNEDKANVEAASTLVVQYSQSVESYCSIVLEYIKSKPNFSLPEAHLITLAKETEGMSIRSIIKLVGDIHKTVEKSVKKDLSWQSIIQDKIHASKQQYDLEKQEAAEAVFMSRVRQEAIAIDYFLRKADLINIHNQLSKNPIIQKHHKAVDKDKHNLDKEIAQNKATLCEEINVFLAKNV